MQRAVESCEALELDDPLRPKLLDLLGDVGAALPCPPCCAGLITRHPLAAGGAKTRPRARIVAIGSPMQRWLVCVSSRYVHVLGSLSRSRSRVLWSPGMIRVPLCASRRDALGDVQFVCTRGRRCFPISRDLLCYAALGLCVCAAVLPRGCYTPSDAL